MKVIPKEPFPFVPPAIRPVLQSCLSKEPSERPTFARIVDLLEDFYYSSWKPEEEGKGSINSSSHGVEKLPMVVESLHNRLKEKDDEIKKRDEKIQQLMER